MTALLVLLFLIIFVIVSTCVRVQRILSEKAVQSQRCFESLKMSTGIEKSVPTIFCVNLKRLPQFVHACFKDIPFKKYRIVLCIIRLRGIIKLFKREKILQTPAAAAALSACNSVASEIATLRNPALGEPKAYCDVAFSGLQALRLYFAHTTEEKFSQQRYDSCFRVNNAFNGSFYKYKTADNRYFSFHVYYASQKKKIVNALGITKDADGFSMSSSKDDRSLLGAVVAGYDANDLEELAFSSGACGCVLRNRDEWEHTPVGKAVTAMPLIGTKKRSDTPAKKYLTPAVDRGPLTGIKVLDLTHIIAGPACSRLLAEYGADVLLVRRGGFDVQEQSFLELDGWAGKHSIQLDFNKADDLTRVKKLIQEADVVVYSYQHGTLDRFGLSEDAIRALNPAVIYGSLMCFSDTVWYDRPGWAPLAEDITGLSIRNGSQEKPKNLNGVPLDYIPGFILTLGVLQAIKKSMVSGGGYSVTASLTRTAVWLHECSDLCAKPTLEKMTTTVEKGRTFSSWSSILRMVDKNAVGPVGFVSAAVVNPGQTDNLQNLSFSDGNTGWHQ